MRSRSPSASLDSPDRFSHEDEQEIEKQRREKIRYLERLYESIKAALVSLSGDSTTSILDDDDTLDKLDKQLQTLASADDWSDEAYQELEDTLMALLKKLKDKGKERMISAVTQGKEKAAAMLNHSQKSFTAATNGFIGSSVSSLKSGVMPTGLSK